MSRLTPPDRVPTLTEVIATVDDAHVSSVNGPAAPADLPAAEPVQNTIGAPVAALAAAAPAAAAPIPAAPLLAQSITADLQAHIDRVLDARLRAALEPVLQQAVARVLEETRRELASTLRDGMARALAQQSSRHRNVP